MRIGIDARAFAERNFTGVTRSVQEILRVWSRVCKEDEYYLFSSREIHLDFALPENFHVIDGPYSFIERKLWLNGILPGLIKKYELDIFWGCNFVLPKRVPGVKYIVTVYDLALFKIRRISSFSNELRLRLLLKKSCERADRVIAISKATAKDIHDILNIPEEKISISYCGSPMLHEDFESIEPSPYIDGENGYFLFLGTIEPRKNVESILTAYEGLIAAEGVNVKLVIAGKQGWKCRGFYKKLRKSPYRDRIKVINYVSEAKKKRLLRGAVALLYPSLYEGFGLPILEAFNEGTPVITTFGSSMPEVGGNAAFYIRDPYSTTELQDMMLRVLKLSWKDRILLKLRMKQQLRFFSWEKNAAEVMDIARSLCGANIS